MKVVYFGHNKRGIKCLETLVDMPNIEVLAAIGLPSDLTNSWFNSISHTAINNKIYYSMVNKPNTDIFINFIKKQKADLGIMCGYSKYISEELRKCFKYGMINLHASNLPYYRGGSPLNWALINGEKIIGISIYRLDNGIDTGCILKQRNFKVLPDDNINTINEKILDLYPILLKSVLNKIETKGLYGFGEVQELISGSYYTTRKPEDGIINWNTMTDVQIHNLVRAVTKPYPGAFFYNSKRDKITIWKTELEDRNFYGPPGRVAAVKDGVIVIAANRGIKIISAETEYFNENKNIFKLGENCN